MKKCSLERRRFAACGALAGFVNGFFGAGGGMLLVPLLTGFCRVEEKKAFATSVAAVLPICLVSLLVYALQGRLSLQGAWPLLLGGAAGGIAGGLLFRKVPAVLLHRALGIFILWGGWRLVTG